jgi:4-diphosphocytidyl-2-C-methyl-D-erythritol kinase
VSAAPEADALSVTVRAPAKINLHLGVGPVRADGFHPLDTVYQAVSLYDDVTVTDADAWSVEVAALGGVDVGAVPLDDTNIAVRAGQALVAHHGLERCARIEVDKGIPVAGGMAGGSADAAATLVALDRLWNLATPDDDLLALAARLGSDVPFALLGGTVHGTGRGELVEPVADQGTWWWVVVPDALGLSTPAVYRAFDETGGATGPIDAGPVLEALLSHDPTELADALRNDLEAAALRLRPGLAAVRDAVRTAGLTSLLSGSGPTYLGLAPDHETAHRVREVLVQRGLTALVATGPVAGAHVVTRA